VSNVLEFINHYPAAGRPQRGTQGTSTKEIRSVQRLLFFFTWRVKQNWKDIGGFELFAPFAQVIPLAV
jgi:hypothetical protein